MTQKLTKKQELAMLDLEIAQLKLEVLTKDERIAVQDEQIDKLAKELDVALSCVVHETYLKDKFKDKSELLEIELNETLKRIEVFSVIIAEKRNELDKIPNWIRSIFK